MSPRKENREGKKGENWKGDEGQRGKAREKRRRKGSAGWPSSQNPDSLLVFGHVDTSNDIIF